MERSDMTSRVIDVAATALIDKQQNAIPDRTLLWTNILKSLSATSAYRREIGPLVDGDEVVNFVLKNEAFPRSIVHCLERILPLFRNLKNSQDCVERMKTLIKMMAAFDSAAADLTELHLFIDQFQEKLIALNNTINSTWLTVQTR